MEHIPDKLAIEQEVSSFSGKAHILLQCSGCIQSRNGVDLVDVSIFYTSEKKSSQTVRMMI